MLDIKINFAYTTFQWNSEAKQKAHVHCVIIEFAQFNRTKKFLYQGEIVKQADNINPYLSVAPDIIVDSRSKPLCAVPPMIYGNKPADGGFLIIEDADYLNFVSREPKSVKWIRPLLGAQEFLHGRRRWCLWLEGISPAELREMPLVLDRVTKCKKQEAKA